MESVPPEEMIGRVLGGAYRVEARLDEGGMGTVFRAQHVRLRRAVAVKVMAAHLADDPAALARFTREAEIISQLSHPHIVQVLDFNTTEDGKPYLVMELLHGRTLDHVLSAHPGLELAAALRIAAQAASALSAAHSAGIVHRDLKPANIFLVDTGDQLFVKLLDFGISKRAEAHARGARKLTGEFDILGTPDYMPPEQALGKTAQVDHRGDQYALGVILYEMLVGHVPFAAKDVMELLQRVIRDEPVAPSAYRPDIPKEVDDAILRAMAKAPDARFPNVLDFAEVLDLALAESRLSSPPNLDRTTDPFAPRRSTPAEDDEKRREKESRRTSWHSKDPVRALEQLLDRARQEVGLDNYSLAASCAESAVEIAQGSSDPAVRELLARNAALIERIFRHFLGHGSARIVVTSDGAVSGVRLTPEQAYLLSRLDGGLSLEDALDLSPLSRELTLSHLVGLMRLGHIRIGA
jgi:serine/threonine protein kinase